MSVSALTYLINSEVQSTVIGLLRVWRRRKDLDRLKIGKPLHEVK